ncbi:MAG TPA: Fur family transcriptional regulator [Jeotgalicoccus sp.]|nr:Fur family transcriptional regulator [Jeotgalicoccus sp.]
MAEHVNYKEVLRSHNLKVTEKRLSIIEYFNDHNRYISPKEVYEYMNALYPGISYDTIYRNLYTMYEVNILEQSTFEGELHYTISCSDHHHHHFICEKCGLIKVVHYCPVDMWQNELEGVKINSHKIELYGLCTKCQKRIA